MAAVPAMEARLRAGVGARESGLVPAAMVWILMILMIVPEGFNYTILMAQTNPSAGPLTRLLWLSLIVGSVAIIARRPALTWLALRWTNPFLLLFVALAFASVLWSIEPALTARRLIRLATFMLVAVAFVLMAWRGARFQAVLRPVLTLVLAGSLVFGLTMPEYAIHRETTPELAGAWRGLANHKNGLGALACFSLIFWFHAWLAREVRGASALLGIVIAVTALVLSRSTTAGTTAVLVGAFLLLLMRTPGGLRPYLPFIVSLIVAVAVLYALAILRVIPGLSIALAPLSMITGKDATMTGRSEIWLILTQYIQFHPLLGCGYAAYWGGPIPGTPSYEFIVRMAGFYPGSAHNGYIEVLNELGWIGLLCLLGYIFVYIAQSLRLLHVQREQAALSL